MAISLADTLNAGIGYFQKSNFKKAESLFKAVLHLDKNNGDALHLMGVLRQQQGRTDEAIVFLEDAVKQDSKNIAYIGNLSNSLIMSQQYERAEEYCSDILKINTDYGPALYHLARICFFTQRLSKAVEYCQLAIENGQQDEQVLLLLAKIYMDQKDFKNAEKYYRQALAGNPAIAEAYNGLGSIYFAQRHIQKAYSMFYQALKKDSQNIDALYNQGIVLRSLGRLDEAAEVLAHAVQVEPNHINTLASLGLTLQELGRTKEAENIYNKVLLLAPDNGLSAHMLSAMQGQKTSRAPADFVTELFDAYAPAYEEHLQNVLEFNAPKLISAAIVKHCEKNLPFSEVLDLGCGTGLMAEELKAYTGLIDGVDLAEKMLEIARAKNLYRELVKNDIGSFLALKSAQYDCCIASDVLIYIGNLEEIFSGVFESLKERGSFAFTTEDSDELEYELRESGRYAHSSAYISSLANKCGFKIGFQEPIKLRKENEEWLSGRLYILNK